jgi:DNA-directed RNA polymerase subunit L
MRNKASDYAPELDASLGLIFRLNDLWAQADRRANVGRIDDWEITVDTIYRNLLYRNKISIVKESDGTMDVKLCDEDCAIWNILKNNIAEIKKKIIVANSRKEVSHLRTLRLQHYNAVQLYDIWVKKFMHQETRLYIREGELTPSGSVMFGTSLKKK